MRFNMYLKGGKRWYNKAVDQAAEQIDDLLKAEGAESDLELAAEYDQQASTPQYRREFNNKYDIHIVIFGTSEWTTVKDAVPYVKQQIASVMYALGDSSKLRDLFNRNGITLSDVRLSDKRVADDTHEHACIMIDQDWDTGKFFALVEDLESHLKKTKSGIVDGTGCGLMGWSIDLAAHDIESCLIDIKAYFDKQQIIFSTQREEL